MSTIKKLQPVTVLGKTFDAVFIPIPNAALLPDGSTRIAATATVFAEADVPKGPNNQVTAQTLQNLRNSFKATFSYSDAQIANPNYNAIAAKVLTDLGVTEIVDNA